MEFEGRVARALEEVLAERLAFLCFAPGSNAFRLTVSIEGEPSASASEQLVATHFQLGLRAPGSVNQLGRLEWEFRPPADYINPAVPETFLEEITNRFVGKLEQDLPGAMAKIFSQVPIANEVYLWIDGGRILCVLPFSYSELEADSETGFEFETQKQEGPLRISEHHGACGVAQTDVVMTNLPPPYVTGIVAQEDPTCVRLDQSHSSQPYPHAPFNGLGTSSGPLKSQGVFVTYYVHLVPILGGPDLPSESRFP
jgi:hypothetical protein